MHYYAIIALSWVPVIVAPIPIFRIWKTDNKSGFSIDSEMLCMLTLFFDRHLPQFTEMILDSGFTEEMMATYEIQILLRQGLAFALTVNVLLSVCLIKSYEDERNGNWLVAGTLVGFVLTGDYTDSNESDVFFRVYVFCAYLDVIIWIPQYILTWNKNRFDVYLLLYLAGMATYDALNLAGLTLEYQMSKKYIALGYNLFVLKFVLHVGFCFCCLLILLGTALDRAERGPDDTVTVVQPTAAETVRPVHYWAKRRPRSDPMRIIFDGKNVSIQKHELMLPN